MVEVGGTSLVFLASFLLGSSVPPGSATPVLVIQPDGVPRSYTLAVLNETLLPDPLNPPRDYTMCVRFYLYYILWKNAIMYYIPGHKDSVMILIECNLERVGIMSMNRFRFTPWPRLLRTHRWYHLCFRYDNTQKTFALFLDGQVIRNDQYDFDTRSVILNGTLVLGQVTVEGLLPESGFSGKITQVNMWGEALSDQAIVDAAACRSDASGDLMAWGRSRLFLRNVTMVEEPLQSFCSSSEADIVNFLFPPMSFRDATKTCFGIGGHFPLPKSFDELYAMIALFEPNFEMKCRRGTRDVWISASDEGEEDRWVDEFGNTISLSSKMWMRDEPNGESYENCVTASTTGYIDTDCEDPVCFSCLVDKKTLWTLYGSCQTDARLQYFSSTQREFGDLNFQGYSFYHIRYVGGSWVWLDGQINETIATLVPAGYNYPMGRRQWEIARPVCGQASGARTLLLTACQEGSFTCDDGSCIPIANRCDFKYDCRDNSDEEECLLVDFPEGYATDMPPHTDTQTKSSSTFFSSSSSSSSNSSPTSSPTFSGLPIDLDLRLDRIDVDTTAMLMAATFKITLEWYDIRVAFRNLKENTALNSLSHKEREMIWVPVMGFKNSVGSTTLGRNSLTSMQVVKKWKAPAPRKNLLLPEEVEVYPGVRNPLRVSSVTNVQFVCDFDLTLYPFDVQKCQMFFDMVEMTSEYLVFSNNSSVTYLGSNVLAEYEVGRPKIYTMDMEKFSHVVVEVPLARLLGHAFLNIYTPSLLLLLTAYTTLYFRMDIFEVRIMTALTALLVMATLFSQVSDSLPKTSNFKMIDVWLLFCIMSSFVIILFHALIDHVYTQGGLYTPELGNRVPQEVLKQVTRPTSTWSSSSTAPVAVATSDNGDACDRRGGTAAVGVGKLGRKLGILRWTHMKMSNTRIVTLSRVVITGGLFLFNVLYWGLIYALRVPME